MRKLLLVFILLPVICLAQIPKPIEGSYVQDFANALSVDQRNALNRQLYSLDTGSRVSMAIVLIDRLPADTPIEDYAREIGRQWRVGRGGQNGLVYVASIREHKQRLEVSGHLEYLITDIRAHELTDNVKSFFRGAHYYEGLSTMIRSIEGMLKTEVVAKPIDVVVTWQTDWRLTVLLTLMLFAVIWILYGIVHRHNERKKLEREAAEEEAVLRVTEERTLRLEEILNRRSARATHPNTHRPIEEEDKQAYVPPIIVAPDSSSSSSSSSPSYNTGFSSSSDSGGSSSDFGGGGASNDW